MTDNGVGRGWFPEHGMFQVRANARRRAAHHAAVERQEGRLVGAGGEDARLVDAVEAALVAQLFGVNPPRPLHPLTECVDR